MRTLKEIKLERKILTIFPVEYFWGVGGRAANGPVANEVYSATIAPSAFEKASSHLSVSNGDEVVSEYNGLPETRMRLFLKRE